MPTESQILDRVHAIDKQTSEHSIKIDNLESWVNDIHTTLKSVETKVTLGAGALIGVQIVIQFLFRLWGK